MSRVPANEIIESLRSYFSRREDIAFAVVFGSLARGEMRNWSDIDVGVYFYPTSGVLELEDKVYYDAEDKIWADIEKISGLEADFLVMNRAPARVVYSALCEGRSLCIRDRVLYLRVLLATGRLFEEYGEFTQTYLQIKARSKSLSKIDKDRLVRIIDFLETEISDSSQFQNITYQEYINDSGMRRNFERWIENLVNGSIDAAKTIIASEKQHIPQTYRETIERLKTLPGFRDHTIGSLAVHTKLRNILAHEYLDIRFSHMMQFLRTAEGEYREFIAALRNFV